MSDIPARDIRIQTLDRCLRDKYNDYTFEDLLERVKEALKPHGYTVAVRQLRKDLCSIRERGGDISTSKTIGHKAVYKYRDRDFAIYQNHLSDTELSSLRETLQVISRFRGSAENAWLEDVITSLELKFGIKANPENLISFETYDNLRGIEHLSTVIDATLDHTPLGIDYKPYDEKMYNWLIYPYYVKQFNGRWFLFGWCDEKQKLYNLALDRIYRIVRYGFEFRPNTEADFNTYFDDFIGVTRPTKLNDSGVIEEVQPETIVMKFSEKRFPYAKTKKMHKSFAIISEEEHTAAITIRPNKEFYARVLEYGKDIEILSPQCVIDDLKKIIAEMYKKYFPVHE